MKMIEILIEKCKIVIFNKIFNIILMKKGILYDMKRYIHSNIPEISDRIIINLDVSIPYAIYSVTQDNSNLFPGVEQFRKDVLAILEDEYHFEVIEDVYDGKRQKGHCSNRQDSVSVYFDTYFDFANARDAIIRSGVTSLTVPEQGKVHCFIHFRFSDHILNDEGDKLHRDFLRENKNKYAANRPDVTHVIREEAIDLDETDLTRCYSDALDKLHDALDTRIAYWIRQIDRIEKVNH